MAKRKAENNKTKAIVYCVTLIILLALIAGLIYCMINGTIAKLLGGETVTLQPNETHTAALADGAAVSFTGADDAAAIYINTDKSVYAQLASALGDLDSAGYIFIFTNREINEDTAEDVISDAIIMVIRFIKSEDRYVLLAESLIENFGTEQDVIIYDTKLEEFCSDTSIAVQDDGKLTMSENLKESGLTDVLYCYYPKTCGCNDDDIISQDFITRIFATAPFENQGVK